MPEFINTTKYEFTDISSEEYRVYDFPGGNAIRIDVPLKIHTTFYGHRIFDAKGESHYIPKGWLHVRWKAKEGQPNFVI